MNYRKLTDVEINTLVNNDCRAENWSGIQVSEGFDANRMHHVTLYGNIRIGAFYKSLEVSKGFFKHSGISNATRKRG